MKLIKYSPEKNEHLKETRGIGFEEVLLCIEEEKIIDKFPHPNQEKYKGQKVFVVQIQDYYYVVPFVETENEIFLKTIIPNRKMKNKYRKEVD